MIDVEQIIHDFMYVAKLAGIKVKGADIEIEKMTAPHTPPSSLPTGKMAVYVFHWHNQCLKVGKVGPKSQARYTSQHYSPNSSNSNLAKSILKDVSALRIDGITDQNVGNWIKHNTDRINCILPTRLGIPLLTLLESFLQCRLKPRFEGFDTQK